MNEKHGGFEEYWPEHVRQHQDPRTRALHAVGAGVALALAATAIVRKRLLLLLVAPAAGYAIAWSGHLLFEKNRPTSLTHPLYSIAGNLKMIGKMLRGQMSEEAERIRNEDRTRAGEGPPTESTVMN
jgi:hypothetical protein